MEHTTQKKLATMAELNTSRRRKALADALAGVLGSLVALWTFYPIDVVKINRQAGSDKTRRVDLFRGIGIKSLHTMSSSFAYFFLYSWILSWWNHRRTAGKAAKMSAISRLSLSAIAAMANVVLTLPLDVLAAQQQTSATRKKPQDDQEDTQSTESDHDNEDDDEVYFDSTQEELLGEHHVTPQPQQKRCHGRNGSLRLERQPENRGRRSLWRGLWPSLLLCSNPSIHYTVFDVLKSELLSSRSKKDLSMMEAFMMGLVAKLCATLATYPLIRAKVMLMVTAAPDSSLLRCLVHEYKKEGWKGLYRGCNLQIVHTVLKSALMMMVRERITRTTHRLLLEKTTTTTKATI